MAARPSPWSLEPWDRRVLLPATALGIVLLAVSTRYGFHRDELYFLESTEHFAWGYVDNPPLTPAIGWLSRQIFGDSLFGLRAMPALESTAIVVLFAAIAREIGADRRGQLLAAVITATSAFVLAVGHLLTTPTFDLLVSGVILLLLCRVVRTGEHRWWLGVGTAIGIGLENKYTIVLLVVSLGVGALLTGCWRALWSWWLIAGAVVAVLLWSPQLFWQIDHGWPQLSFARSLAREQGGENRATLVPFQLVMIGPPLAPVLIRGWWALLRRRAWARLRFVPVGYVVLLVALLVTGGKGYYAAGMFAMLIPAGAVATVDWVDGCKVEGGTRVRLRTLRSALVTNAVVAAVITLPLLPQRFVDGLIGAMNEDAMETVGWPSFVDQVAAVAQTVPAAERAGLVVLTADYGQAGAIDRYGPARGLRQAFSGHNSYADFRIPAGTDGPVLVVGYDDLASRNDWFTDCRQAGTVHSVEAIENQVDGAPLWLCDAPSRPWSELWPRIRHEG